MPADAGPLAQLNVRRFSAVYLGLIAAVVLVSCRDDASRGTSPTSPLRPESRSSSVAPGTCTTLANITNLVNTVFGAGAPNARSALGKLDNLDKQLQHGNISSAQSQANNLIDFINQKVQQGGLPGTAAQIQALIAAIQCYAGLTANSFVVFPSDAPQVLLSNDGLSGISLQGGTVTVPTVITITILPPTTPPLNTKLDQYPGFVSLTESSPLTKPAVVGVCPATTVPASIVSRLRLGHQALAGFEITPVADASFLTCPAPIAQASRLPGWLASLVSLVTPKPLYAKTFFAGGVGGLVTELSPFGPVDPELFFAGGVGGTVTELQKRTGRDTTSRSPTSGLGTPDLRINTVVNGVCTAVQVPAGTALEPECRPGILLKTLQGTIMQSVPVGWAIALGGGTVAPEASVTRACGVFGTTASTFTNVNGKAGVCWILGPTPGSNTVVATPSAGGDAPAGVFFSPANITFTATGTIITPTATAIGGTFVFDGLGHFGSGTCSNNLTPVLTYTGDDLANGPVGAGSYTVTVTCGAGNPNYVTVSQSATITITRAPTLTTVTCPATVHDSPPNPCTASVSGPGLSLGLTPSYSQLGQTVTATASYAGGKNWLPSQGSATYQALTEFLEERQH